MQRSSNRVWRSSQKGRSVDQIGYCVASIVCGVAQIGYCIAQIVCGIAQTGCSVAPIGWGVTQTGCGVAHKECDVAQILKRRLEVRQARVCFPARYV